jgi:pyruvate dehydrogenase E1 component alpha subunit
LEADDYVISAYRDHGYALALGCDPKAVMAELFGKVTGLCRGKGGSMHLFDAGLRFLGGDGIVAGQMPVAVGVAYAIEYRGGNEICMCFFGDGAINEGAFHESLNLASVWKLPVVFLCENNTFGMGTPVSRVSAESDLSRRARGYNMRIDKADGMDLVAVREVCERAVNYTRRTRRPTFVEVVTYRYVGHSVTDPQNYRRRSEIDKWRPMDPIPRLAKRLVEQGLAGEDELERMDAQVRAEVEECVRFAQESPDPEPADLHADVFAD